jgi:hypothetical protein
VPGSFGAQIATKRAPDIAGNVGASPLGRWETKCLEIFGPKLPSKQPLILHVILEPTCLSSFRLFLDHFWTGSRLLPVVYFWTRMDWFWTCFGVILDLFCSHFGLVSDLWGVILTGVGLILKLFWTGFRLLLDLC